MIRLFKKVSFACFSLLRRRAILTTALVAVSSAIPLAARAISVESISIGVINWAFFGLSKLIAEVFGVIVMIEGFALQVMLVVSMSIANSPVVRLGFPVVLSFANLAFVLGLIVIAISTIVGLQSYGMKNLLWKLMVMAIVINFGLVICGMILGFSDNITMFLVNSVVPEGSSGLSGFADTMAGAFNPQRSFLYNAEDVANAKELERLQKAFSASDEGADFAQLLQPIVGMFMTTATLLIMVVVLGALVVMLLVRYVKLAFALVTLPLAWASWPFPAFSHYTSKWWEGFLRQAFFPPIVVFTLWLGITVAQEMSDKSIADNYLQLGAISSSGGAGGAAKSFFGGLMGGLLDQFIIVMVVGGIMTMGLIAAQSFGIQFAGAAMNAVKAGQGRIKREFTSRAARTGRRVGLAAKQKIGVPAERQLLRGRLAWRKKIVEPVSSKVAGVAAGLPIANRFVKAPAEMDHHGINAAVYDKDGNDQGKAIWDHDKHDWKKNDKGNFITDTGKTVDGRIEIKDMSFVDVSTGKTVVLDKKALDKAGFVEDNKPVADFIDLKSMRAIAAPTTKRIESRLNKIAEGKVEAKIKQDRYALAAEAEKSGGIIRGFAGVTFGATSDAAKTLASEVGVGGGRGEDKKDGQGAGHGKRDDQGKKGDHH